MNRASKVALGLAGVGGVACVAAVLVLPGWIRGQADAAIADLQDELGLDIEVGSVVASVFADFPNATVTLGELHVRNRAPFEGTELLRAGSLEVMLDVWSLAADAPRVRGLRLTDASIDLAVSDGRGNWVLGDATGGESSSYRVDLDDVRLDAVDVRYHDADAGVEVRLGALRGRTHGAVGSDAIALTTDTSGQVSVSTGGTTWLDQASLSVVGPVSYTTDDGRIGLEGLAITLGGLGLALDGDATPAGDGWDVDLTLGAPKATFAQLVTLLPAGTLGKGVTLEGDFTFDSVVRGHYGGETYPGGAADFSVTGASVSSGGDRIDDLRFVARIEREEGPLDATRIDVSDAHMRVAGSPIRGSMTLAPPQSDPMVGLEARGRLDLGAVDRATGGGLGVDGTLDLDVAMKGRASRFSEDATTSAAGRVRGEGIRLPLSSFEAPLQIDVLDLVFEPKVVDVRALSARVGPTDVAVVGSLQNAVAYGLGQGPLRGQLDVTSRTIDLRTPDDDAAADDGAAVVTVPTDLDLDLDLDLGEIYQGDYHLTKVRGGVGIHGGTLTLERVSFQTMGGTVKLDGTYAAPTAEEADVAMDLAFEGLAMDELMATMDAANDAVPAASNVGGRVGGQTRVRTRLLADTSPDLPSLFSEGLVLTVGSSLSSELLRELADRVGDRRLAGLSLDGARFDYKVEEGRLTFQPVAVQLGPTPAKLVGSAGIVDKTIDVGLVFNVATKGLQAAGLKLPPKASKVDITAGIKGPYARPKLALKIAGVEDIVDVVKDEVVAAVKDEASKWVAEAERQGDRLIAEAEEAADVVRAEAEKVAAGIRKEAKRQGAKLVKAAKNPLAKAAAERASDALVKTADKQADKVEAEADKQATSLIRKAKDEKAKRVADARERTD